MISIGYFGANSERTGLLVFAPDGSAIGGFDPGPSLDKKNEFTVIHTADGQVRMLGGYVHPDELLERGGEK